MIRLFRIGFVSLWTLWGTDKCLSHLEAKQVSLLALLVPRQRRLRLLPRWAQMFL